MDASELSLRATRSKYSVFNSLGVGVETFRFLAGGGLSSRSGVLSGTSLSNEISETLLERGGERQPAGRDGDLGASESGDDEQEGGDREDMDERGELLELMMG